VGERGVIVDVLKFRSMRVNSRSDVEWNPTNDAVTKIGKVLRVTGLDELPQLWNILKGDMSLVGPRPERPFFVEQFKADVPRYDDRHRVPVGLTGLAQVHGLRGDTSIDERARLDNQYIENWSLWRDVVILFQTFAAVIRNTFEPSGATGRSEATAPVRRIHRVEDQGQTTTPAQSTQSNNGDNTAIETATPEAKEASSIG
jgi:lipopolysaccharide/colanic/teichoic acid biosynthesis glycosyltransferase